MDKDGERKLEASAAKLFKDAGVSLPNEGSKRRAEAGEAEGEQRRAKRGRTDSNLLTLKHLSTRVLRLIERNKKLTVQELTGAVMGECAKEKLFDGAEKGPQADNIRRRVRETINVLAAIDLVRREGSSVEWRGVPDDPKAELARLQQEREQLVERVRAKTEYVQELVLQAVALEQLVQRNKTRADRTTDEQKIPLPFIVVSTAKDTVIECEMAENKTDIFFNFNQPFQIHDDNEILRRMDLHKASRPFLKTFLPAELMPFVPKDLLAAEPAAAGTGPSAAGSASTPGTAAVITATAAK